MIFREFPQDTFTEVTGDLVVNVLNIPFGNFALWSDEELAAYSCYRLEIPSAPDGKSLASYTVARVDGVVQTVPVWSDASPAPVPQSVTPRQARLALLGAGLLDGVEAAVQSADKATQIAWEFATEVRRDDPLIAAISTSLGLTDAQTDSLFRAADAIA